jgi:hypothetical protein
MKDSSTKKQRIVTVINLLSLFTGGFIFSCLTSIPFFWLYQAPKEMYDYSVSMFLLGLLTFGVAGFFEGKRGQ